VSVDCHLRDGFRLRWNDGEVRRTQCADGVMGDLVTSRQQRAAAQGADRDMAQEGIIVGVDTETVAEQSSKM
jgi:hypothetical protein